MLERGESMVMRETQVPAARSAEMLLVLASYYGELELAQRAADLLQRARDLMEADLTSRSRHGSHVRMPRPVPTHPQGEAARLLDEWSTPRDRRRECRAVPEGKRQHRMNGRTRRMRFVTHAGAATRARRFAAIAGTRSGTAATSASRCISRGATTRPRSTTRQRCSAFASWDEDRVTARAA